jgi:hypothetical protein
VIASVPPSTTSKTINKMHIWEDTQLQSKKMESL